MDTFGEYLKLFFALPAHIQISIIKHVDDYSLQELAKLSDSFADLYTDKGIRRCIIKQRVPGMILTKINQRPSKRELVGKNIIKGDGIASSLFLLRDKADFNFRKSLLSHGMHGRPTREELQLHNILPDEISWQNPKIFTTARILQRQLIADTLAHILEERLMQRSKNLNIDAPVEDHAPQGKSVSHRRLLQAHLMHRPSIVSLERQHIINDAAYVARVVCPAIRTRVDFYERLTTCPA